MHFKGRPSWSTNHGLPYDVNFVFWVSRQTAPDQFPPSLLHEWLQAVVTNKPVAPEEIVALISNEAVRTVAVTEWATFNKVWTQMKRQLDQRLHQAVVNAKIQDVLNGTEVHWTFLHTDHPGDFVRKIGDAYVLGDAYFDSAMLRKLVMRLAAS